MKKNIKILLKILKKFMFANLIMNKLKINQIINNGYKIKINK
jgi:hypothetical protein